MKYDPISELADSHKIKYDSNCDYYVIGDVHGCMDEYFSLHHIMLSDSLERGREPKFIQLGDMIDRGPVFNELIVKDPADYKIMGNHELNFINEHYKFKQCRSKSRAVNHDIFDELEPEEQKMVLDSLIKRVQFLELEIGDRVYVFSHSPIKNIENGYIGAKNMFGHMTTSDFSMRSTPVDLDKISNHKDKVTYCHGHQSWNYDSIDSQVKAQKDWNSQCFNLDSSCVYGEELVALRLNDLEIFRVKSNICVDK